MYIINIQKDINKIAHTHEQHCNGNNFATDTHTTLVETGESVSSLGTVREEKQISLTADEGSLPLAIDQSSVDVLLKVL